MGNNTLQMIHEYLQKLSLSDEQVSSGLYQLEDLVELKIQVRNFGPIHKNNLKIYLTKQELPTESFVRAWGSESKWIPLYEHSYFQRRKPQLVKTQTPAQSASNGGYVVLKNGQKCGPVDTANIAKWLQTNELQMTDLISSDGGVTWCKIYHLPAFDRRKQNATKTQLPPMPDYQIFVHSNQEVENSMGQESLSKLEREAMASLAFVGNINSGKAENLDLPGSEESVPEETRSKVADIPVATEPTPLLPFKFNWKKIKINRAYAGGIFAAMFTALIILGILGRPDEDFLEQEIAASTSEMTEQEVSAQTALEEAIKQKKFLRGKREQTNFKSRFPRSRTPASFKDSSAYKNAMIPEKAELPEAQDAEGEYFYDDASEPVELDPVREQVSSETLNPDEVEDVQAPQVKKPRIGKYGIEELDEDTPIKLVDEPGDE